MSTPATSVPSTASTFNSVSSLTTTHGINDLFTSTTTVLSNLCTDGFLSVSNLKDTIANLDYKETFKYENIAKNLNEFLTIQNTEKLKKRVIQIGLLSGVVIGCRLVLKATCGRSFRFTDRGPLFDGSKKKTVRVYFLRHGESKNNARQMGNDRLPDPPLTTLGEQQSIAAGHYLSKLASYYGIRNIFISPMLKTLQTAIPLVKSLGTQLTNSTTTSAAPTPMNNNGPGSVISNGNHPLNSSTGGPPTISNDSNPNQNLNSTGTISIPCEVYRDLFEYGGIYEGDRKTSDADLAKHPPNFGLTDEQILKNMPGVICGKGITKNGWWRGGKETDKEYLNRIQKVASWLWNLDKNSLIITHGKFLDTLFKVLLEMPDQLETQNNRSNAIFLHGGCAFSCLEFDHETKKVGVMYLNQPIIADSKLRTGHKIGGFSLKQW